jgi:AAA15 family ATPase/GTPase
MLISFSFQNWMSFRDETEFSMKAGQERQHKERLATISDHDLKLLPVSAVYGGNASGKSNFVKALEFCNEFVCGDGYKPEHSISAPVFLLDKECAGQPSCFSFALLADNDVVYEYNFSVTRECVLDETLVRCGTKPGNDVTIYHRNKAGFKLGTTLSGEEQTRFQFLQEGTHNNQLFLTNAVSQQVKNEDLLAVYNWFHRNLVILTPESQASLWNIFIYRQWNEKVSSVLSKLDTGIMRFVKTEISQEELNRTYPPSSLNAVRRTLSSVNTTFHDGISTFFHFENGEIRATQLETVHESTDGEAVHFSLDDESDGTKRAMDLIPVFINLSSENARRVVIIDEIDRSMHTLMIQSLIQAYLASCNANNRSQLVFTTHNVMLMDQDIFRRDEIWVTERQSQGQSKLYSFAEFKDVRSDKQIRKSYLQGRMGGIPNISLHGPFNP